MVGIYGIYDLSIRISVLCMSGEDGLNLEASWKTSQGSKSLHVQEVRPTVYYYPTPVVYGQELWSVPVVRSTEKVRQPDFI